MPNDRLSRALQALTLAAAVVLGGCATLQDEDPSRPAPVTDARRPAAEPAPTRAVEGLATGVAEPPPQFVADGEPETTITSVIRREPAADPLDLWGQMRLGFLVPLGLDGEVHQHAQRFGQSGYLMRRADRLRAYLPLVVAELRRRNMPMDLAMLPLIESALNPLAVSHAGAVGTFQIMPATGRELGLVVAPRFVDARKDFVAAMEAGLNYLQQLYREAGDWNLAMAAYNGGLGRVLRAVERNRLAGLPTDFEGIRAQLPAETQAYVPQIHALKLVVQDPRAFGADLPGVSPVPALRAVPIAHDIDVALAARLAGISEEDFLALNTAVRGPVVLAAATSRLLLPLDAADRFEAGLAQHTCGLSSWRIVRLPQAATVDAVAAAHGVSAAAIRRVNWVPSGMKPDAGSTLLLPRVQSTAPMRTARELLVESRLEYVPDVVALRVPSRRGETLLALAARLKLPLASLRLWNPDAPGQGKLPPGRDWVVWVQRDQADAAKDVWLRLPQEPRTKPAAAHKAATKLAATTPTKTVNKTVTKPLPKPAARAGKPVRRAAASGTHRS